MIGKLPVSTKFLNSEQIQKATNRVECFLKNHSTALLSFFILTYLATTTYKAGRKLFWFDELYTVYISGLSTFQDRIETIRNQVDLNPPLFGELIVLSRTLISNDAIAVRMPSILGFGIFCLCLYRFVANATTSTAGWVALLFPLVTTATFYSFEARPHGIILGFAGLALIFWQNAAEPRNQGHRQGSLIGLGFSLAMACLNHVFGCLVFFPFLLAELARTLVRRKPDLPVLFTLFIAATALGVTYWVIQQTKGSIAPDVARVSWNDLPMLYLKNLGMAGLLFITFIAGIGAGLGEGRNSSKSSSAPQYRQPYDFEWVAAIGFVLLPVTSLIIAIVGKGPLYHRYSLSCIAGFALLAGFVCAKRPLTALTLCIIFAGYSTLDFMDFYKNKSIVEPSTGFNISTWHKAYENRYDIFNNLEDQTSPIAVIALLDFMPTIFYASEGLRERLIVLNQTREPEMIDSNKEGYKKLQNCCAEKGHIENMQLFLQSHQRFLAVCFYDNETSNQCNLAIFTDHGWQHRLLKTSNKAKLFELTRTP